MKPFNLPIHLIAILFALVMPCSYGETPLNEAPVTVEGILQVSEFFGPPNYGENPKSDRIEHSFVLQLPAPLVTQLSSSSNISDFSEASQHSYFVQLVVFDEEKTSAKRLVGKKVKVVGTLFEAETGHHRTPILLAVKSITEICHWQW